MQWKSDVVVRYSFCEGNRMPVKVKELIAQLETDGWFLVRTKGSHRQYHHPGKPGTVTLSGKLGMDVPIATLSSVLRQAGLKK